MMAVESAEQELSLTFWTAWEGKWLGAGLCNSPQPQIILEFHSNESSVVGDRCYKLEGEILSGFKSNSIRPSISHVNASIASFLW